MFFTEQRLQFFRPLTGKYREQVVECLRLLYQRLYSASADYGESLRREQVVEIFAEALVRAPLLEDGDEDGGRFKSPREQAGWILNLLVEHGWLERQVDQASFQSTYPFSRSGRLFTQALSDADSRRVRTRHRNTRNTLNALEAFSRQGEPDDVYNLLDALEFSERIIADFSDVIAELEERKRELVREVESQQLVQRASEEFFAFMEQRFQPDLAVRLSADSVEKHRDQIQRAIDRIRRKPSPWKAAAERALRRSAPELLVDEQQSVLWQILNSIEARMRNAAELMLPALRRTLQSFTARADIIIRQLSYLHSQRHSDVVSVCRQLAAQPREQADARLARAGEQLAAVQLGLLDPGRLRLRERERRAPVRSAIFEAPPADPEALRELALQQLLDRAFAVNAGELRDYLRRGLGSGYRISSRDLPLDNARDLLALSQIISLGAADQQAAGGPRLRVEASGEAIEGERYFDRRDEFILQLEDDK